MTTRFPEPVLNQPIENLNFTAQFRAVCKHLKFTALSDLLQYKPKELITLPGFDLRMLSEYIAFLEKQQLGFYLN